MRKLLRFTLLFLFVACAAKAAAPTIVQQGPNTCFASGVSTVSCSFPSNVTAGNMIIVFGGVQFSSTFNTPTMTGETFTSWAGAPNAGTSGKGHTGVWAVNSAVGGQKQVTLTITSGTADMHLHIIEVSGAAASPRDAQGNTECNPCAGTPTVSTSGATTTATDLVLAFFYDNANNRTLSAGSGYAQVAQTNNTTGGDVGFSESKTVSTTGTQTATATGNSGDVVELSIIAIAGASGAAASTAPAVVY
jgi:hypothetical protein